MKNYLIAVYLAAPLLFSPLAAQEQSVPSAVVKPVESGPRRIRPIQPVSLYNAVDSPTAEVLDYGSFAFTTRFFRNGGMLPDISFGVMQRVMIGASLELDNYVGHGNVNLQRPELQVKFRFFDGDRFLPAAAVGYNSQGYLFDKTKKDYLESERGLYFAFTREILASGLEWTFGGNVSDFEQDSLRGFTNAVWVAPGGGLGLVAEYDNIHTAKWNRLNSGVILFMSPFVQMGFYFRDLLGKDTYRDSTQTRRPERIIDLRYTTSF